MARLPTLGSLFDDGLQIFGKEWKHLVSAVVLLYFPLTLVAFYIMENLWFIIPYIIFSIIVPPLLQIIITTTAESQYRNDKTISGAQLYKHIHDRFFPVLWTFIVSGVFIAVPLALVYVMYDVLIGLFPEAQMFLFVLFLLLFLVVAVCLSIYFFFALPISVLEGKSGPVAIKASIHLVKGKWWSVFFRWFILAILGIIFSMVLSLIIGTLFGYSSFGELLGTLLQQVVVLPISIAYIVFYLYVREPKKVTTKTVKKLTKKATKTSKKSKTTKR